EPKKEEQAKKAVRQFDKPRAQNQQNQQRQQQNQQRKPFNKDNNKDAPRQQKTERPVSAPRSREREPLVNIKDLAQNAGNKRVFDKKKDEKRNKNSFDDYNRSSKRNLLRKGLMEESNIEERIRSNRKIKK
ncbi:MAG: hypothetical protein J6C13_01655, partial [Clostridia bacterium]|nr:hypothetical protein [Clostridia bacterium]